MKIEAKKIAQEIFNINYKTKNLWKLIHLLNKIDPAIIYLINVEYRTISNGKDFLQDLNNNLFLKFLINTKVLSNIYNCLYFKRKATKIDNKYWKGEPYDVIRNEYILKIIGSQTYEINLFRLLSSFKVAKHRRMLVDTLQKLPAEVLIDLSIEKTIFISNTDYENYLGYYLPDTEYIALCPDSSVYTIVHEIGHSLDFIRMKGNNKSSLSVSKTFKKIFNKEMNNYLIDGNIRYDDKKFTDITYYATKNEEEMFAECYVLFMTGFCNSQVIIEQYFPQTLDYVKKQIIYNRRRPKHVRYSL